MKKQCVPSKEGPEPIDTRCQRLDPTSFPRKRPAGHRHVSTTPRINATGRRIVRGATLATTTADLILTLQSRMMYSAHGELLDFCVLEARLT